MEFRAVQQRVEFRAVQQRVEFRAVQQRVEFRAVQSSNAWSLERFSNAWSLERFSNAWSLERFSNAWSLERFRAATLWSLERFRPGSCADFPERGEGVCSSAGRFYPAARGVWAPVSVQHLLFQGNPCDVAWVRSLIRSLCPGRRAFSGTVGRWVLPFLNAPFTLNTHPSLVWAVG